MNIKENILNCVAQVNKLLSQGSGATLFNPEVTLVDKKFTTISTVTSVTADLIRSILGKPTKDFDIRYQNDIGSHARASDNEIIFDVTSVQPNESSFYKKLLGPIGNSLSIDFIMYHEITHVLQGQYWNKRYYDESQKELSSFLHELDNKHETFSEENINLRLEILKGPRPIDYDLIEDLKEVKEKWENSTEGQLCKAVHNQRSESWADCFSLLMIYKTHGVDEFKKVLAHVIQFREQGFSNSFEFDLSKNKMNPFPFTHNTSQALFELKKCVLDESVDNLDFEGINKLIASCVTNALAKDLYKTYFINAEVQEVIDKKFKSVENDLFDDKNEKSDFYEISTNLFSDREIQIFNKFSNNSEVVKDIIRLPGVCDKIINTNIKNLLEDTEFQTLIKQTEPISQTNLLTLNMAHLMVKLVEDKENPIIDSKAALVLLDKIVDFETVIKHTEALVWVYKSGALDIKLSEAKPNDFLIEKEPSEIPIKKIRDKLFSGIFYKEPEKIILKK